MSKLIHPGHFIYLLKLSRRKIKYSTASDDAQLKLYAQILPDGFLHYGYFENPSIAPEKISLYDIQMAQLHYAELILDQAPDKESPVLDVGCGMGGLLNLLRQRGYSAVGLTPDRYQLQYLKEKYPDISLIHGKFQEMPVESYMSYFGTVINSESLQYIKLDRAVATVEKVLKPQGRWIVIDYFRTSDAHEKSGHLWEVFEKVLHTNGFKIVYQQDITQNIFPTLAYVYMYGKKIGLPLFEFLVAKLQKKRPATYYLFEEVIEALRGTLLDQLDIVNPDIFTRDKKYMLLVIERD